MYELVTRRHHQKAFEHTFTSTCTTYTVNFIYPWYRRSPASVAAVKNRSGMGTKLRASSRSTSATLASSILSSVKNMESFCNQENSPACTFPLLVSRCWWEWGCCNNDGCVHVVVEETCSSWQVVRLQVMGVVDEDGILDS